MSAIAMPSIPSRTIPFLSFIVGVLLLTYMALVVVTVVFATWQTDATSSISDAQAAIGTLESQYYTSIGALDSTDPTTLGYVQPTNVQYVAALDLPNGLTFAGN